MLFCSFVIIAILGSPNLFESGLPIDERMTSYLAERVNNARWIRDGWIPIWNPYSFYGSPNIATQQNAVFYPPNLIFYTLFTPVLAMKLVTLLHVIIAGWFTGLLLLRLGTSRAAALVGGSAFMLCGHMMCKEAHVAHQNAMALLPALVYTLESFIQRPAAKWLGWMAVVYASMILAGYMHVAVLAALMLVVYAAIRLMTDFSSRLLLLLVVGSLGGILGTMLASVQLVTTFDFIRYSPRSELTFEDFAGNYFPLDHWPLILFPLAGGSGNATPYYMGQSNLSEITAWVGFLPMVLALVPLLLLLNRRMRNRALPWLVILSIGLLLTLGPQTPLYRLMYHVPVYKLFRGAARNLMEVHFAIAMLAGLGTHGLIAALRIPKRSTRIKFATTFAVWILGLLAVVLGCAYLLALPLERSTAGSFWELIRGLENQASVFQIPVFAALAASFFIIVYLAIRKKFILLLALAPFVYEASTIKPRLSIGSFAEEKMLLAEGANPVVEAMRAADPTLHGSRVYPIQYVVGHGTFESLPPSLNLYFGVRSLSGYGPLFPARLTQLYGITSTGMIGNLPHFVADNRLFSLMNVRYFTIFPVGDTYSSIIEVLSNTRSSWMGSDSSAYRKVLTTANGVDLWENLNALPRAYTVERLISLNPYEGKETSLGRTIGWLYGTHNVFDPRIEAVHISRIPKEYPQSFVKSELRTWQDGPNQLRINRLSKEGDAFIVITETMLSGWKAYVDGNRARISPVNGILMGVHAPAGSKQIRLIYRPDAFVVGAVISAVTLLIVLYLILLERRFPLARIRFRRHRSMSGIGIN